MAANISDTLVNRHKIIHKLKSIAAWEAFYGAIDIVFSTVNVNITYTEDFTKTCAHQHITEEWGGWDKTLLPWIVKICINVNRHIITTDGRISWL